MLSIMSQLLFGSSSSAKGFIDLSEGREQCGIRRIAGISHAVLVDVFYPRVVAEFGSRLKLQRLNGGNTRQISFCCFLPDSVL